MHSEQLTYRPLEASDAGRIATLVNEWDIARMTSRIPHPYTLLDADLWLGTLGTDEVVWAVEHDGQLIGAVGYLLKEPDEGEIGYWIGKPWWGRGFATEATQTLVKHCFGPGGFRRLTCGHFADNPASARVIAKLGFRRTGTAKQWCEARGSEVVTIKYARRRPVLAALWRQRAA